MKIAFTGCWHSNHTAIRNALDFCRDAGITTLIQTGDFLYDHGSAYSALAFIERYCREYNFNIEIYGIRGNHDNPEMYTTGEEGSIVIPSNNDAYNILSDHVFYIKDGSIMKFGDTTFAFLGGAHSVDRCFREDGVSWWEGEAIDLEAVKTLSEETFDVLVTHEPPAGIEYPTLPPPPPVWDIVGAEASRIPAGEMIEKVKPGIVISGHMHLFQRRTMKYNDGTEFLSIILDHGHYPIRSKSGIQNLADFIWVMDA